MGSFPNCISPYGLLDMTGSLWEWIYDYYNENYDIQNDAPNPRGSRFERERVKRGSNWMNHPSTFKVVYPSGTDLEGNKINGKTQFIMNTAESTFGLQKGDYRTYLGFENSNANAMGCFKVV